MVGSFLGCVHRDEEMAPRDQSLMAEKRFTTIHTWRRFLGESGRRVGEGMAWLQHG
jgi:hypothetical protein